MDEAALLALLREKLSITIEFNDAGKAYWSGDHTLTVTLKLGDTVVSDSTTYIPNPTTDSPY